MRHLGKPIAMLLIAAATAYAGSVIKDRIELDKYSGFIVVKWGTENEVGVVKFEVLRSEGSTDRFQKIAEISELKGSNSSYEYEDHTVFRTTDRFFKYKVRVVFQDGTFSDSAAEGISFAATSAAKRTWGSIKAMFR